MQRGLEGIENMKEDLIKIITNDGQEFKISRQLSTRYSSFIRDILEDQKTYEDIILLETDYHTFQQVISFLNLHKENAPVQIKYPLKGNTKPNFVMEENDAAFLMEILNREDDLQLYQKLLNTSAYLQMEDLKKRLMACLTIHLLQKSISEGLVKHQDEIQMREECRKKLQMFQETREEGSE